MNVFMRWLNEKNSRKSRNNCNVEEVKNVNMFVVTCTSRSYPVKILGVFDTLAKAKQYIVDDVNNCADAYDIEIIDPCDVNAEWKTYSFTGFTWEIEEAELNPTIKNPG